jgi:hypothetical protein
MDCVAHGVRKSSAGPPLQRHDLRSNDAGSGAGCLRGRRRCAGWTATNPYFCYQLKLAMHATLIKI